MKVAGPLRSPVVRVSEAKRQESSVPSHRVKWGVAYRIISLQVINEWDTGTIPVSCYHVGGPPGTLVMMCFQMLPEGRDNILVLCVSGPSK